VHSDDRCDVAAVETFDRRGYQGGTLAHCERAQAREGHAVDVEVPERRSPPIGVCVCHAEPAASRPDDPLPQPCGRPLRMTQLGYAVGASGQCLGSEACCYGLVAQREEESKAKEAGTVQLAKGRSPLRIRRSVRNRGAIPAGCVHQSPSQLSRSTR
jgi:hypothetical protein